ncbi:hypothetical protein pipiens_016233, partial [Culex pipiens pipiens]
MLRAVLAVTVRKFCSKPSTCDAAMKYLNVAEKNDAAKNIAALLSRGASQRVRILKGGHTQLKLLKQLCSEMELERPSSNRTMC